jgi:hypothetical protein
MPPTTMMPSNQSIIMMILTLNNRHAKPEHIKQWN